jgi:hypothetical protein
MDGERRRDASRRQEEGDPLVPETGLITPAPVDAAGDLPPGISPPELPPDAGADRRVARSGRTPRPWIAAHPNPVPDGEGLGQTTISWSTDSEAIGQVWVRQVGAADVLLAQAPAGAAIAAWIQSGVDYEFRLFAGTARRTLLGSVVVGREQPTPITTPLAPAPDPTHRGPERPLVRARISSHRWPRWGGTTAIVDWSTGDDRPGRLVRLDRSGRERLVADGARGSAPIGGVSRRRLTLLRLYGDRGEPSVLAQTAAIDRRPYIQAVPNPVPKGDGLGTTTICWATRNAAVGHVYLLTEDGQELPFAAGAEGIQSVTWIAPNVAYRFRLYAGRDRRTALASVTVTRGSEWREIALDLAFLGALVAPVGLLLLVVYLALRAIMG